MEYGTRLGCRYSRGAMEPHRRLLVCATKTVGWKSMKGRMEGTLFWKSPRPPCPSKGSLCYRRFPDRDEWHC